MLGLATSIPIVIFASTLLVGAMQRFPIIVAAGAALLGWVAGALAIADPAIEPWIAGIDAPVTTIVPAMIAFFVFAVGRNGRPKATGSTPARDESSNDG